MPFFVNEPAARRIYLMGIGGTAMASLAGMLQERGFTVSGSDSGIYPPMSTFLAGRGIPVHPNFRADNLASRPDLVVVGNAIARGNPELEHVLNSGIPYTSLPELVRLLFLADKTPVVVTGTHGKTTTASMMAWSLEHLGASPSFLIGGIPLNFQSGYRLGTGPLFVLEGDEYDTVYYDKGPKFLHYRPSILIVNNIEYDHADIYPDLAAILRQFRILVNMVPGNGLILFNHECPNSVELARRAPCPGESVGLASGADWQAADLRPEGDRIRFQVLHRGEPAGELTLGVPGEYNVRNSLAVCGALHHLGYPWAGIQTAMEGFLGVERRMTLRAEFGGVRIFDDFAHHPTAIRETLRGTRQRFPGARIWAVFEPRSWTCRRNVHQQAMETCFEAADTVILADVFRKEQLPPAERFDPARAVAGMSARGQEACFVPTSAGIVDFLGERLKPGDIVVIMSNGGFDDIHQKLLEKVQSRCT